MANLTLSLSDALYARMREHSEFRWSEIARRAILQKLEEAEIIEDIKAAERGERDYKAGKTTTHAKLIKELGLGHEL